MNPAMLELLSGFRDRMEMFGQPFLRTKDTGAGTFQGMMFSTPRIIPQTELGYDPREKCSLEVRRGHAPALDIGEYLKQVQPFWRDSSIADQFPDPIWKVIDREDNPADFAVKYWVVRVTDGDSQP